MVTCASQARGTTMPDLTANALLPLSVGIVGFGMGVTALFIPRLRRSRLPALLLLIGSPLLGGVWWAELTVRSQDPPQVDLPNTGEYRIALSPVQRPTAF